MTSTSNSVCLLCNCPSSCSLGQGDLIIIQSPTNQSQSITNSTCRTLDDIPQDKRHNFILETGKILVPVDSELFNVGFPNSFDVSGNLTVHERCLKWSLGNEFEVKARDYQFVQSLIVNASKQKCFVCDRYGASLSCRDDSCQIKFHLPCAQSSGCFFSHTQLSFYCLEHLDSVVPNFGLESSCEACSEAGDVRGQLFCTNCDKHYHAECLMLESNRVVRTGWRCPDCKICQTCRQSGDDAEMIMCNVCDKGYHTFCLRNQSIPKDGWSCSSCLSLTNKKSVCSLCQNEILAKQNTRQCHSCQIRVHSNCQTLNDDYYDDDTVYFCRTCSTSSLGGPMDENDDDYDQKEIYRSSSNSKINRLLSKSQKSSHSPMASPSSGISTRKRRSIDYSQQSSLEYTPGGGDSSETTTPSTNLQQNEAPFLFESIKDESSEHSMDLPMSIKQEFDEQPMKNLRTQTSQKSGKGKPIVENRTYGGEISKKRARRALNNGHRRASSPQPPTGPSQTTTAAVANQTRAGAAAGTGCRGRPPKIRKELATQSALADEVSSIQINVLNTSTGSTGSSYTVGVVKRDDDEHHAVTVLCASDELFTLGHDMCVSCGSFGVDEEGRLISCTQCGQSYHTYCAGLNKLSKVILKQGWRCLDCTVCEGCGKPTDESRLLLCDDCDISYHTYCLQPPLDQVPKGNWKCQWCVRCLKCGTTNPGPAGSHCLWENNYTECAPCHSLVMCPVCQKPYRTDELIVQCTLCDRWLHGSCEHILSEDSTLSTSGDLICSLCRPMAGLSSNNEGLPTSSSSPPKSSSPSDQAPLLVVTAHANQMPMAQPQLPTPKATKLDEGVYLTDTGLAQLKSIRVKPLPKKAAAAAVTALATNSKSKRAVLANYIGGGVKRNNSSSIQDDDMLGNSGTSDDEGSKKTTATVPTARAAKGYTGIGGFHVKVRGQRRRQDATSNADLPDENLHDDTVPGTNKRKRDRRPVKKKSLLEEHMPPEMQEAFFGTDLAEKSRLMAQHHITVAPLQLNEQTVLNNNSNNEYTIKLDHETVNRFLIKKATKLALAVKEEQKQQQQQQQPSITSVPTPSNSIPAAAMSAADDESDMQEILDNEEFCNFVEYMMSSSKTTQDPMLPLCGPTDIEDFLEFIEHPEAHNDLQAVDLLNNTSVATSNSSTSVQVIQSQQTTMITSNTSSHHPSNSQVPLATPTSNLVVMATNVNDNSKQIINNLAREMMESTGLHTTTTSSILNTGLIVKQEYDHAMMVSQQQQQQQQQPMIRMQIMPSTSTPAPASTTPTQDRSGSTTTEHTNLMERTREDELLGQNATMSNVLFCNVNHPELKQQFPDFTERFKQMKKIWRKVPTETKQSYTQQARLNRTKRRALKSTSSQSSTTSKGGKRKNSAKQQSSEQEDTNDGVGGGSESRSSTPSSSTTNETTTVVIHPNEHHEHPQTHLYQQPRQIYSPSSGNLMVTTPNNPNNFHHQPYATQPPPPPQQQQQQMQRPQQQQGYGTPGGYPQQRFSFPPQQPPPQNASYFEYAPSTPRPILHQTPSSAESTPLLHSATNPNQIRKSTSSSDANTPYHHVSPMDDTSPYHQQQSPYPNQNQMKPQQPQLLPRGMQPRPPLQQIMPRFPQQDTGNFVRTPSSAGVPGQPTRFIFASPTQQTQPSQQPTHYVQYTQQGQGQHTVVVQQGSADGFQRMPESPAQHMQQHHQVSPQFSPHHHPMTPNSQQHPMQHHMSPYPSQQQPNMHHPHAQQPPQHSPTIVVQPQAQFSPSSVHHHQLTLATPQTPTAINPGHQSPTNDPSKRQIQMQKPLLQPSTPAPATPQQAQLLVKHESMSFDEQQQQQQQLQPKIEAQDDSLNESINTNKTRADPLQSVPAHVLEQIDEVINDVVSGGGSIPQDITPTSHIPTMPVQIAPLSQPKLQSQHMITTHHPYIQQQPLPPSHDWSNYQQQPTLNIATAVRGLPPYSHYHTQQQQQQQHHDLIPATTNVINTAGVPQHEQQQIVAERISSILASSPHEQQQTTVTQAPIQIKRAWPMNQHQQTENHFLATSTSDPSISLEDLLERDFKDKQLQQQQAAAAAANSSDWSTERNSKSSSNQQQSTPLSLAHAVHLLQQAITHPLYQQSPPPELSGLISVGRDTDLANLNTNFNEEQFERYAKWLKQRREINSLRIKADETNLADIKKKRNILLKKQKQSLCTPEEEQEMPRLSQQQTEYSRTLTAMRKERKQFDELEQAFIVYKQSRMNALCPMKSSPDQTQQPSETIVRMMSINNPSQMPLRFVSEQPTITLVPSTNLDEHDESVHDEPTSSPSVDSQPKQTFSQQENQSIASSSPTLTLLQPLIELAPVSMNTSSPMHENDPMPFEPCRSSPMEDESNPTNVVDGQLEQ